tara:strand:- start:776 stop:1102 length:327 start_codon:yes stop_codon:yes gene_type:complete
MIHLNLSSPLHYLSEHQSPGVLFASVVLASLINKLEKNESDPITGSVETQQRIAKLLTSMGGENDVAEYSEKRKGFLSLLLDIGAQKESQVGCSLRWQTASLLKFDQC